MTDLYFCSSRHAVKIPVFPKWFTAIIYGQKQELNPPTAIENMPDKSLFKSVLEGTSNIVPPMYL